MEKQQLAARYLDILSSLDTALLDKFRPDAGSHAKLSGLFLPSVPPNIQQARHRVMVVGAETAGWKVLNKDERFTDLPAYIEKAMNRHQYMFESGLNKEKSRGFTFFNFLRSAAKQCGTDGLIYTNLFCFDWKGGSPIGSPYFDTIKRYSEQLLKAQIDFFKPDIIIFANGISSASHRREFFPIKGDGQVCRNSKDYYSQYKITKHHLWEFTLHDKIRCLRIHHPSAFSKKAQEARKFIISLLPFNEKQPTLPAVS